MTHKHLLHELLKQDQEPFHLKTFISDRRSQLKPTTVKTFLNLKKPKPTFCINHVCLFSLQNSPEFKTSPFLHFPAKSPRHNASSSSASVFLPVPAKTAAMLVEAASRVQKPKPGLKPIGLGLFGSFLRRLKDRSLKIKRREIEPGCEEIETACSSTSVHEFEEIECFCSNPSSPFRFSLQRSPSSPTLREPVFSSSVVSPSRRFKQDKESYGVECPQEINRQENEEEKEQCSPVSVLDPLFDDVDEEEERDGRAMEEDYDIESCYESVQRAKHQLLQKLQRFERLAGLDPIKLENQMLEHCYREDEGVLVNEEELTNDELFREIVNHLGVVKIPWYMKKLVCDLIKEENKNEEHQKIVQKVCKQLHSWKMVELNTIDMMVETEFISEGWKRCDEKTVDDIVMDIEVAIFGLLVEELVQ